MGCCFGHVNFAALNAGASSYEGFSGCFCFGHVNSAALNAGASSYEGFSGLLLCHVNSAALNAGASSYEGFSELLFRSRQLCCSERWQLSSYAGFSERWRVQLRRMDYVGSIARLPEYTGRRGDVQSHWDGSSRCRSSRNRVCVPAAWSIRWLNRPDDW